MPKGRLNNPSTRQDGEWFAHIGMPRKLPMTSTQNMFYPPKQFRVDYRLPPICITQRKNEVQNGYPFSAHDNRHLIQGVGEYFDIGLGHKKTSIGKRQDQSQNFCRDAATSVTSRWDDFSLYEVSYTGHQATEQPLCRRFPKRHTERSAHMKLLPENAFMWFADHHGTSR
ncbi:Hypothetical predicted protein [Pelobates cultripes]|uniref:Domain of unknown function with conserved HDNR motif domain-containing protein n=1 Tax=Pelobates cultripes TaxID=61616 RepID=A0AAD1T9Z3_PELCU|nr:Hypothetical predicted protein [Pelobates cultripes]